MRKEATPPVSTSSSAVGRFLVCFETKPLIAALLALTLVMLVWNLPPYYSSLISTARPCSAAMATVRETVAPVNLNGSYSQKYYSVSVKPSDPNKRIFQPFGNAAALFVMMGAYRGGPATFAVVGLASKPIHVFGKPWFKCEWISNNGSSVRAKAYKILPDWGYGRVYTVVVVNCTFATNPNAGNSGGKLLINAYYDESPRKFERFTALEELPGSYNESRFSPPYPYEYLYCGSPPYGNLSAARMREWIAYHAWFFGERSHFVFHDAGGVTPEVMAVLDPWVRAGRATVQDIRDQVDYDGYYYNQFLIVNDCLHRYRHAANWTFFFDVDEYIYLPNGNTLESILAEFSDNTQFTIEQNPMSSVLCLNDSTQDYAGQWGFEKLVFRESRTGIRRDRKYAIQARNTYATGVHMSENAIGKTLHRTETKIRYYHYHNTITFHEELCRELLPASAKKKVTLYNKLPYNYDDNMNKLVKTVKEFEQRTLGTNQKAKNFS
ncbi:PREDICTED: galactan beta-1,4-galactosyltransferase GALS1-like [Tarenaya hassleriana]|uniref:galactan beta-1,4-galactosyltransferase GALS1-like n=1 Tax=Tarenaya hassleriana TaxID=28532 RepID=UPI00053C35AE|nr:PREDICTED: galactan beta-1,4-galactosyltransferase GALS1-like [Tarenaya hassleriana]